jgi:hypothetical protein
MHRKPMRPVRTRSNFYESLATWVDKGQGAYSLTAPSLMDLGA